MEGSQGEIESQSWNHAAYPGPANVRMPDIIAVLSGLRKEVEGVEAEIQKVESELLSDPENKVLNRKFERLLEEKRNKEARRERLELQLTASSDHLYSATPHGQGLLGHHPDLQLHHPYYQLHAKRPREDGQPEYSNMQGFVGGIADGMPHQHNVQQPPKGTGRGGKGGHKFCKRCKERITYGHQQKCKFCRKCYDENKELVLRSECPHGHDTATPAAQPSTLLGNGPLEQHQAVLEAQQHQLQLQMLAVGQPGMSHLATSSHHMQHHVSTPHALAHDPESSREPGRVQVDRHGNPTSGLPGTTDFQDSRSDQTAARTQELHQARDPRLSPGPGEPPQQQLSADSAFEARGGEARELFDASPGEASHVGGVSNDVT